MHELQITFPVGDLLWYAVTPKIPNEEGLFNIYFETFCRVKLRCGRCGFCEKSLTHFAHFWQVWNVSKLITGNCTTVVSTPYPFPLSTSPHPAPQ